MGVSQFEQKCPMGLEGTPPNLDLVAMSDKGVIGVESKCTEFLCQHTAKFSPAYAKRSMTAFRVPGLQRCG
jgi:hypothetical protein